MIDTETKVVWHYANYNENRFTSQGLLDRTDRDPVGGGWLFPAGCTDIPLELPEVPDKFRAFNPELRIWEYKDYSYFAEFALEGEFGEGEPRGYWDNLDINNYIPPFAEKISKEDYDLYKTGDYIKDYATGKPKLRPIPPPTIVEYACVNDAMLDLAEAIVLQDIKIKELEDKEVL